MQNRSYSGHEKRLLKPLFRYNMKDKIYTNFVKRWEEVTDLPPQTLGPFTSSYKDLVHGSKSMPVPVYAAFWAGHSFRLVVLFWRKNFVSGFTSSKRILVSRPPTFKKLRRGEGFSLFIRLIHTWIFYLIRVFSLFRLFLVVFQSRMSQCAES